MRVLIVTTGSRGDVQPNVALARALAAAGHEPLLAAPRRFAGLAQPYGIAFAGLDDRLFTLQDEVAGKGARAALTAARSARGLMRGWLDDLATLSDSGADIVVYAPKTLGAPHLADAMGVPSIAALTMPLYTPTTAFAAPILPPRIPPVLNRVSWRAVSVVEAPYRRTVSAWRAEVLGLSGPMPGLARRVVDDGVLHAWSRHLLPAPPDWPAEAAPLGFWALPVEQTWAPPDPLVRFLQEGEPPVYVGFGSTAVANPEKLTRAVLDGVARSGRRAILATGWGALTPDNAPPGVLVVDEVPHDWLFARTAAAVHHGGAGTVAAALRSGIPQVVRPLVGDQPFWAWRVRSTGAGVALTGGLTPQRLAAAIDGAVERADTARALGERVRAEERDALARAVAAIERRHDRATRDW